MSKILRAVFRAMKDLHAIGLISDEKMKEFEELCRPDNKKARNTPRKSQEGNARKHKAMRKSK